MNGLNSEILNSFLEESKTLVNQIQEILEEVEEDTSKIEKMKESANLIDRIMGGAKSLAQFAPPQHALGLVGDISALCKTVSYKALKIPPHHPLFVTSIAFLIETNEILEQILNDFESPRLILQKKYASHFPERLKWISGEFEKNFNEKLNLKLGESAAGLINQDEVDDLLKKLGIK